MLRKGTHLAAEERAIVVGRKEDSCMDFEAKRPTIAVFVGCDGN